MIPSGGRPSLRTLGLVSSVALLIIANVPVRAQTAEEQERSYRREAMEQALQTKESFDLYGLHFDSDKATIQPESKSLLDDIATALKNFPDWHLRIVGHTDSTGDPEHNVHLSLDRALAIEAALVERGVDHQRLVTAGLGESRPVTSNATPEGRALNRRVELVRVTDSAEAKKMLKAMSDFLAAQKTLSVGFDTVFEVVTPTSQKLGLASSGTATLARPDKIRVARSGGFGPPLRQGQPGALTHIFVVGNPNIWLMTQGAGKMDDFCRLNPCPRSGAKGRCLAGPPEGPCAGLPRRTERPRRHGRGAPDRDAPPSRARRSAAHPRDRRERISAAATPEPNSSRIAGSRRRPASDSLPMSASGTSVEERRFRRRRSRHQVRTRRGGAGGPRADRGS